MVYEDEVPTRAEPNASAADVMAIAIGTEIGGYVVDGDVGRGGMGVVYSATHPVIGKRAAIKVLRGEVSQSPGAVARFIQEARAVNQIHHPNIIDIFAFGTLPDGRAYHVMDLLIGEPLRTRLKRGRLSADEAASVIDGITSALIAAHDKGFVHRDLKPDNIFLVTREDAVHPEIKLLDFGLAKLMPEAGQAPFITKTGIMIGTPEYMSPEQARGLPIDARTDVYALGVLTFEILTSYRPFSTRGSPLETLRAHAEELPPQLSAYVPGLDDELIQLVDAMLAKAPADRPSLAAVRTVIRRLRTRTTTLPPPLGADDDELSATIRRDPRPTVDPAALPFGSASPVAPGGLSKGPHAATRLGVAPPVRPSAPRLAALSRPAAAPPRKGGSARWLIVGIVAIAIGIALGLLVTSS